MAYVYLLDMNKFVEQRQVEAGTALHQSNGDPTEKEYIEGRASVLKDFQEFLLQNYIPKLPRRIRETYYNRNN